MLLEVRSGSTVKAKYTWLADGSKLRVRNNSTTGFDYLGSLTYTSSSSGLQLETAQFASGVIRSGNSQEINYFITDHLGSVRAIVNSAGTPVEQNDYYAFGAKHVRSNYAQNSNRFDFNGKEEQTTGDLDYLDYGARPYDPTLGRWFNVDPLAECYLNQSPYKFCSNNPMLFVDLDGMYEWLYDINTGEMTRKYPNDKDDPFGPDRHIIDFGYADGDGAFRATGSSGMLPGSIGGFIGWGGDDGWLISNVNLWEGMPDFMSGYKGYNYNADDLMMRYKILNDQNMYHGYRSTLLNWEAGGWAEPLTGKNYWNTYGQTLGTLRVAGEYIKMANDVSTFVSFSSSVIRPSKFKYTPTHNKSINSSQKPSFEEFNQFRSQNKGRFSGQKGRGTNVKESWNVYLKEYGYVK